jgi:hypothetical protein
MWRTCADPGQAGEPSWVGGSQQRPARGAAGAPPTNFSHAARAQSASAGGLVDDEPDGGDGEAGGAGGEASGGGEAGGTTETAAGAPLWTRCRRGSGATPRNVRTRSGLPARIDAVRSCGAAAVPADRRVTMNVALKTMTTALTSVAVQRIIGRAGARSGSYRAPPHDPADRRAGAIS